MVVMNNSRFGGLARAAWIEPFSCIRLTGSVFSARWLGRWLVAALLVLIWVRFLLALPEGLAQSGLFRFVGSDFSMYLAQSLTLRSGDPSHIYELQTLDRQLQTLLPYAGDASQPLRVAPVPYPPLFAWLFTPFTLMPAPAAFAVWTALNVFAGICLGLRCASISAPRDRAWIFLLVLTSLPVAISLVGGQPMLMQACAVGEAYLALRAGRDLRGGLWLSALLFKPQYVFLIGPVLVWKRRWTAVAGLALGAMLVLFGSVVLAGPQAALAYPSSFLDVTGFRNSLLYPEQMINWRAVVLVFFPTISDRAGLLLTATLSLGTVLAILPAWRGAWRGQHTLFPYGVTALLVVTLLTNYHSYNYGGVLMCVPIASILSEGQPTRATRLVLYALLTGPVLIPHAFDLLFGTIIGVTPLFQLLLLLTLACLIFEIARRKRQQHAAIGWPAYGHSELNTGGPVYA